MTEDFTEQDAETIINEEGQPGLLRAGDIAYVVFHNNDLATRFVAQVTDELITLRDGSVFWRQDGFEYEKETPARLFSSNIASVSYAETMRKHAKEHNDAQNDKVARIEALVKRLMDEDTDTSEVHVMRGDGIFQIAFGDENYSEEISEAAFLGAVLALRGIEWEHWCFPAIER